MAMDWSDLAARARAGDVAATTELLRALYGVVRKQIHFQVADAALAEDAVQETMIALHRGLASFRGDANPRTWAITIAMRIAWKLRRRAARAPIPDDAELAVFDTDTTGAAELALLRRTLARLDDKKRAAFVLMGILELTAEEAGRALATSPNTAASRYRHARAELEDYLTRKGES